MVRHGESEANRDHRYAISGEIALTQLGRQQASQVAQKIAQRFNSERLISSDFRRALQTSEIISAEISVPLQVLKGLHERDMGCLKGEPFEHSAEVIKRDLAYDPKRPWLWRPAGGKSFYDVRLRVVAVIEELSQRHPTEEVVVVSHGAVMLSLSAHITGSWENSHHPVNCGIVLIEHENGRFRQPSVVGD
jgi:2,3-bisphosphoglycerate-dependent phosphoglycerate mutase